MSAPVPPAIVDTHCHLDFHAFDEDRAQVVEKARQSGVVRILNPGIDLISSQAAIHLADQYAEVYAAVGVHPNESLSWSDGALDDFREMAARSKQIPAEHSISGETQGLNTVVAIGEIGLDYYRDRAPHDQQRRVFQAQLELAAELGLPVVVHNRQAAVDLLPMLADWQVGLASGGSPLAERPGVLHSFSEDEGIARLATGMNFLIGITGPITFRNAPELQKLAVSLPLACLLVETDAPFLAPHPYRGQRNEPGYVRLVVEKIAGLQNQPIAAVAEVTASNAQRLFHW